MMEATNIKCRHGGILSAQIGQHKVEFLHPWAPTVKVDTFKFNPEFEDADEEEVKFKMTSPQTIEIGGTEANLCFQYSSTCNVEGVPMGVDELFKRLYEGSL